MRTEKRDNSPERRVLISMIVDKSVLGRISPKWEKPGLFNSTWSNIIGGWCCKYYDKYQKAPGKAIEGLFESWASDNKDQETIRLMERFLESLSGEYAQLRRDSNSDYILDIASTLFNRVRLNRLSEAIQGDIDSGDTEKAAKRVENYGRVEVADTAGTFVLEDRESIRQAFKQKQEPLIHYKGALGNFFGDCLERDGFIAFMGPEKRGKSWMLMDIGWRGMEQGRKVAFFAVGDMSKNQMMLRFMTRAARRPLKATEPGKDIKYPVSIEYDPGSPFAVVDHRKKSYSKPLSWQTAWAACQNIVGRRGKNLLQLSCHANSTLTAQGLLGIIRTWERSGWVPDVIVIDYADVLAPEPGYAESRDQINATWKRLRTISQIYHCLVVTATQSDAASYDTPLLSMKNFSEDKRKFAHVTAMMGLNQTPSEKKLDLMRFNWLVLRESDYSEDVCIHVAGCRDVANPTILSTF